MLNLGIKFIVIALACYLIQIRAFRYQEIDLVIKYPRNHESIHLPKATTQTSLTLSYDIAPSAISTTPIVLDSYRMCVEVLDTLTEDVVRRNRCYPCNEEGSVELEDMKAGDYLISSYIMLIIDQRSNQMVSEKRSIRVIVEPEKTKALSSGNARSKPSSTSYHVIEIKSREYNEATNTITFVTAPEAESSSVTLHYAVDEEDLDASLDELEFCLKIVYLSHNDVQSVLDYQCISTQQNPFTLSNIKVNNYLLFTLLRRKDDSSKTIIPNSKREIFVSVRPIDQAMPTISFPSCSLTNDAGICVTKDLVAEAAFPTEQSQTDISIMYQLFGYTSSFDLVQVCVEVFDVSRQASMGERSCLPLHQNVMTMHNVPAGRYEISFILALSSNTSTIYQSTERVITLEVQPEEEFIPSYDWQLLHAWHRIPTGIETR
jgi:hypothetical protein